MVAEANVKVLSVQQPWAWAIVNGWKPLENRDWVSNYRGPLYIHAPKTEDQADIPYCLELVEKTTGHRVSERLYRLHRGPLGHIVGRVTMVGCVTRHSSPWFFGQYAFLFEDAIKVHPIRLRGQLGIFNATVPTPRKVEW